MHGIGQKNRQRIGQAVRPAGRLAAAALLAFCFFGVCYPELAFSGDVCRKADGSAMEAQDYEALLDAPEGGLQITFSFLTPEKRGGIRNPPESLTERRAAGRKITLEAQECRERPVGVFDSGVGGLTVVREIMRQIPNEKSYISGTRPGCLWQQVPGNGDPFLGADRPLSADAAGEGHCGGLQHRQRPMPWTRWRRRSIFHHRRGEARRKGGRRYHEKRAGGVIGTEGTIGSGIYSSYIHQLRPEVRVTGKACPLFVPLVEEGLWEDPVTGRDRLPIPVGADRYRDRYPDPGLYPLSADPENRGQDHGGRA